MFNKRLFSVAFLSLSLAACGGGKDKELSREYGLILQVNSSTQIGNIERSQVDVNRENPSYGANFEACTKTVKNADGIDVQVPIYDNTEQLTGELAAYCDGTRRVMQGAVTMQARFLNNTFDPMSISYTGTGIEIRIYAEDGSEVWNSLVAQGLANAYNKLEPFDPFAHHDLILQPGQAFPSQTNYPITYIFTGDSNYQDADGNPATFDLLQDFSALGWNSADSSLSQCEPAVLQAGTTLEDMGTVNPSDDKTRDYQKPLCQTQALAPGKYTVKVTYSFTPAIDPVTFDITINAPAS